MTLHGFAALITYQRLHSILQLNVATCKIPLPFENICRICNLYLPSGQMLPPCIVVRTRCLVILPTSTFVLTCVISVTSLVSFILSPRLQPLIDPCRVFKVSVLVVVM
jgi:hypothetical protein